MQKSLGYGLTGDTRYDCMFFYYGATESPRFIRFISEVMSGDKEKARFMQKSLGYGLTGDTRYDCMFFYYGATTRNGKGTLMESTLHVMGDYFRGYEWG